MSEFHRKIELQSPEDLQYLIANVRRAANEKIDRDLPPIEGEDKMRERVEELVHDYITTVFRASAENITINGLVPSPDFMSSALAKDALLDTTVEEHEPFNAKLFERAKDLARKEEDLVEEIAALRRKMPLIAVEGTKKSYTEGITGDELALKREIDKAMEEGRTSPGLGIGSLPRQATIESNWDEGIKGLEKLKRTMPETVAKKERAEKASDYVLAREKRS